MNSVAGSGDFEGFSGDSEETGTKIVGYGSGRFLSSRVRFGSGRSFNMSGRLS